MTGYVSSIQSMGTLDGPGVRFVAFLQGCNLRCGCCHNPETQSTHGGEEYTPLQLVEKAARFKTYFGADGGITLSGGEPLLQTAFATEVFRESHRLGINTCLDTSGSVITPDTNSLLEETDIVLLDIKYHTDELYRKYVGCSIQKPLDFLDLLNKKGIPTVIRQVTIPGLNDNEDSINFLKGLRDKYPCITKTELLPFKKICITKYKSLGKNFPFESFPTPTAELMQKLNNML